MQMNRLERLFTLLNDKSPKSIAAVHISIMNHAFHSLIKNEAQLQNRDTSSTSNNCHASRHISMLGMTIPEINMPGYLDNQD